MKIYTIARHTLIEKLHMDITPTAEMRMLPPALRGEWYPFQIYVTGKKGTVTDIRFLNIANKEGDTLGSEIFTVLQLDSVDYKGEKEKKTWETEENSVFWVVVKIPENAVPDTYDGLVSVVFADGEQGTAPFSLQIQEETIQNHGFDDAEGLSRIGWLNSELAIDHSVPKPYTSALWDAETREISVLGRKVKIGEGGLPAEIRTYFDWQNKLCEKENTVLRDEMKLIFTVDGEKEIFSFQNEEIGKEDDFVKLSFHANGKKTTLSTSFCMEFDGYAEYFAEFTAKEDLNLDEAELIIPFSDHAYTYFSGLGHEGGDMPETVNFKWDSEKHQDSFWVGNINAGIKVQLRDKSYVKPNVNIYYPYRPIVPPAAWHNDGKGGVRIENKMARIFSGSRRLRKGETLCFGFTMMITPLKPIDYKAHFEGRYYQKYSCEGTDRWLWEMEAVGANIVNIHHATDLNPYINTPFFETEALKEFADKVHAAGNRVKLYYTIRELSVYAKEFEVFRSLGYEIFQKATGIDGPSLWQPEAKKWIGEHYGEDLIPAWRQEITEGKYKGKTDASVITNGQSRLCNFYIEGLRWLMENCDIDGIYIDDVAYDRTTMKRARKIIDKKENGLIDFHTWNHFDVRAGMANSLNIYTELLPYINDLWVGEGFKYKTGSPAYWLTEISGMQYGLMSTMMLDGNFYKGLLYGESTRYGWRFTSESAWPLWDSFGIGDSEMIGYWNPACPVQTDSDKVFCTVYAKKDKMLVCLASWAEEETCIHLSFKDNLRIKTLAAPEIEGKQKFQQFTEKDSFTIQPDAGLILEITIEEE